MNKDFVTTATICIKEDAIGDGSYRSDYGFLLSTGFIPCELRTVNNSLVISLELGGGVQDWTPTDNPTIVNGMLHWSIPNDKRGIVQNIYVKFN